MPAFDPFNPDSWKSATPDSLPYRIDTNARDKDGRTPLHLAAGHCEMPKIIELLLRSCAENTIRRNRHVVAVRDNSGKTPLHFAAEMNQNPEIIGLLCSGANNTARDQYGWLPLHYAIRSCHDPEVIWNLMEYIPGTNVIVIKELMQYVSGANSRDKGGWTLLHLAAKYVRHPELIEMLIQDLGARVNVKDGSGKTPLDIAKREQPQSDVHWLLNDVFYNGQ